MKDRIKAYIISLITSDFISSIIVYPDSKVDCGLRRPFRCLSARTPRHREANNDITHSGTFGVRPIA